MTYFTAMEDEIYCELFPIQQLRWNVNRVLLMHFVKELEIAANIRAL